MDYSGIVLDVEDSLIDFELMVPEDIRVIAPTVYTRLNILNYCQFLAVFLRHGQATCDCEHSKIIQAKIEIIKQIISRIVQTDTVFNVVSTS
ncbi:DNA packaging protein UL33 [Vespertilionid gammaherpesvirus 1]|uniref:DNA packaging protein UL33 n=1 Tax=Vespertilionid gammaherpesvirus 1 TaxID=2560830 RepID=A0A0X9X685_9GAMA|nr:DNA packaging protein UL33 [Myotis gammaherpesvirus 8]AMA67425.1 DNA packaging protein UL33 [Vespertilionid gammaherpesvirus 1]